MKQALRGNSKIKSKKFTSEETKQVCESYFLYLMNIYARNILMN